MTRCDFSVFAAFIFSGTALAQHPGLDSFFRVKHPDLLNGGLLIAQQGRPVFRQSSGMADFQTGRPNSDRSVFNLASISKVITSTAILQLMEKKKLRLDAPVKVYLPAFPYENITIKHLLSHTSGLPDLELYEDLVKAYPDTLVSNKDIIPQLAAWKHGLSFQPGDKWQYANTNFDLLALVIEKTSGLPYPAYLERYIFNPSGMKSSSVFQQRTASPKEVIASVHQNWFSDTYGPADSVPRNRYINYNLKALTGSTNILTTMEDMLLFDRAIFSGVLLKKATLELAFTPVRLNDGTVFQEASMDTMLGEGTGSYGLGWDIFEQPAFGKSVGHGGFNYGLGTFYYHRIGGDQVIIAYDNTGGPQLARAVTSAVYILNGLPGVEMNVRQSLARAYGTVLARTTPAAALLFFHEKWADTVHYYLSERELNWLGYDLLRASFEGHLSLAFEVFRNNTLLFPRSFNVFDSFGELLEKMGMFAESYGMYRRSLVLNPRNTGAAEALKRLESRQPW